MAMGREAKERYIQLFILRVNSHTGLRCEFGVDGEKWIGCAAGLLRVVFGCVVTSRLCGVREGEAIFAFLSLLAHAYYLGDGRPL